MLIFSQLFFYPLNIQTRVSMGVIVLHFILLVESGSFYKKLIALSSGAIFIERLIYYLFIGNLSLGEGIVKAYPIFLYYIVYLVVVFLFKFEKRNLSQRIILLFSADTVSNLIELSLRGEATIQNTKYIFLVSLIRVAASFIIFLIYRYRMMIMADELHQKKYISLNLLVSSLEAELFYLKKSTGDIAEVMKKAHKLYLTPKIDDRVREDAMGIAREVHEIKKDYMRIINGMEKNLHNFTKENSLPLTKLCEIISANTKSYIEASEKNIDLLIESKLNISIRDYHKLFIIVNNLIVNAFEAIEKRGTVEVDFSTEDDNLIIVVKDDGRGIA